jgi:hypothetical protein
VALIVPLVAAKKFHSVEEALAALAPRPLGTWRLRRYKKSERAAHRDRNPLGPFQFVPPQYRDFAQQKYEELCIRWYCEHPGQLMPFHVRISKLANAANHGKHYFTRHWRGIMGQRWQTKYAAQRYLKEHALDEFRSQPIAKRVKRLPCG